MWNKLSRNRRKVNISSYLKNVLSAVRISAVLLPCFIIAASFYFEDWRVRRYLLFYVAPLVSTFLFWMWIRFGLERVRRRELIILDLVVVGLALLRAITGVIPFSGHMLFIVYSGLLQKQMWYRFMVLVLLVDTTYFKLVIWNDPLSWSMGALLRMAFAIWYGRISIRTALSEPGIKASAL